MTYDDSKIERDPTGSRSAPRTGRTGRQCIVDTLSSRSPSGVGSRPVGGTETVPVKDPVAAPLVADHLAGIPGANDRLLAQYDLAIKKTAHRVHRAFGGDWWDIYQDLVAEFFSAVREYDATRSSMLTFLWRSVTARVISRLEVRKFRDAGRRDFFDDVHAGVENPEADVDDADELEWAVGEVRRHLGRSPGREWFDDWLAGRTFRSIAEGHGVSAEAVARRVREAIRRAVLAANEEGQE
jgi:DNA-directed RNA polymerase specialized sigma24 family protein